MGWPKVGISQSAREYILFLLVLDQGDCFASGVERHTYHQLLTLPHIFQCYSYTELAGASIEPRTLRFLAEHSTD